jgi:hypothetical protein
MISYDKIRRSAMALWYTDVAGRVAETVVNKLFNWSSDKKDQPPPLLAPGLAVGYYDNFLSPLSEAIYADTLRMKEASGSEIEVPERNTKIEIIIPQVLSPECFASCRARFEKAKKGTVYLPARKRWFGVNYVLVTDDSAVSLNIVDLARPVMASRMYYKDIAKIDVIRENPEWNRIQFEEIAAFRKTLERLLQIGSEALANRITYFPVG